MTHTPPSTLAAAVGAALLLGLTALSTPASAEGYARADIFFAGNGSYNVTPPSGWACQTTPYVQSAALTVVELSCASLSLGLPMCGTVTAGVSRQTGGVGVTDVYAICGTTTQGHCTAHYTPVTGANNCAVTISGGGLAKCQFNVAGTNYQSWAYCNFPVI